ncbi:hypothetical protein PGTUg99_002617 [Puccinia graminis f. sp. tritici]|uniref:Uncharacterized protein n=1 Tax=Puccinia graminis f. sp. tritici TaxID=56615 RepID=A0A5B0LZF2_PUCGR|nr:hypothetical protein PGTUg99_002617 [Puccinia graminis f. sp. tritici]
MFNVEFAIKSSASSLDRMESRLSFDGQITLHMNSHSVSHLYKTVYGTKPYVEPKRHPHLAGPYNRRQDA